MKGSVRLPKRKGYFVFYIFSARGIKREGVSCRTTNPGSRLSLPTMPSPLEILASLLAAPATLPTRPRPVVRHPEHPTRPRAHRHRGCVLCRLWRVERIRTVDAPRKAAFAHFEEFATGQRRESHWISVSASAGRPASWSAAAARRLNSPVIHAQAAATCLLLLDLRRRHFSRSAKTTVAISCGCCAVIWKSVCVWRGARIPLP